MCTFCDYHPLGPWSWLFLNLLSFILFRLSSHGNVPDFLNHFLKTFPLGPLNRGLDPVTPLLKVQEGGAGRWGWRRPSLRHIFAWAPLLAGQGQDSPLPSSQRSLRGPNTQTSSFQMLPLWGHWETARNHLFLSFLLCPCCIRTLSLESHLPDLTHWVNFQPGLRMGYESKGHLKKQEIFKWRWRDTLSQHHSPAMWLLLEIDRPLWKIF